MQQHHTNVDNLLSLGKDPCKEYKLCKAPVMLVRVRAGNKTCSICNRVLTSTQSLKNHIQSAHMDETCYQCDKCGKSFGDSYVLQVHVRKHQPLGRPHKCRFCGKGFATIGHRNQHLEVHHGKSAPCQYCGTTFTHTRSLIGHEKRCDLRPGGKPAKEFKCMTAGHSTTKRKISTSIGLRSMANNCSCVCMTPQLFCFAL